MLTIAMLAGLGAAEAREVLIYNDNGYAWSEAAAVSLGYTVRTVQGDWVPFQAAYATGVVDVLVIESAYGELPTQVVDVLQAHILAGLPYIVTHWGLDQDAQLRAVTGVTSLRSYYQPEAVTSLAGADPFGLFVGVGEVAMSGDYITDDGDYLTGGVLAGLTSSGNGAIRFSRAGSSTAGCRSTRRASTPTSTAWRTPRRSWPTSSLTSPRRTPRRWPWAAPARAR